MDDELQDLPDYVHFEDPADRNVGNTSTEDEAANDAEASYDVLGIIAEEKQEGRKRYLTLWENYTIKHATWEPRSSFASRVKITEWEERKAREMRGEIPPFDVQAWRAAKVRRKALRKGRRKRAGILVSSDESSDEAEEDSGLALNTTRSPYRRSQKTPPVERQRALDASETIPSYKRSPLPRPSKKRRLIRPNPLLSSQKCSDDSSPNTPITALSNLSEPERGDSPPKRVDDDSSGDELLLRTRQQVPRVLSKHKDASINAPVSRPFKSTVASLQAVSEPAKPNPSKSHSSQTPHNSPNPSTTTAPRPEIKNLISSNITRNTPATRGGRSATRGGLTQNVFQARDTAKQRPTLIQTSSDSSKAARLFSNARLRRKAELQASSLADAAPNLASLGGVFDPAKPPSKQARVRKDTNTTEIPNESAVIRSVDQAPKESLPLHCGSITSQTLPAPKVLAANSENSHVARATALDQRPSGVPGSVEQGPSHRLTNSSHFICFWLKTKGCCSKGDKCAYVHNINADLPVASAPYTFQNTKLLPCTFFSKGHCKFSAQSCEYSHELSSRPGDSETGQSPREVSRSDFTKWSEDRANVGPPAHDLVVEPRNSIFPAEKEVHFEDPKAFVTDYRTKDGVRRPKHPSTCKFWMEKMCWKDDMDCPFFHSYPPFQPRQQATSTKPNDVLEATTSRLRSGIDKPAIKSLVTTQQAAMDLDLAIPISPLPPPTHYATNRSVVDAKDVAAKVALNVPIHSLDSRTTTFLPAAPNKRLKPSEKDYSCANAMKELGKRAKQAMLGSGKEVSCIDFGEIEESAPWSKAFCSLDALVFDQTCSAQDFELYQSTFLRMVYKQGPVVTPQSDFMLVEELYDQLRLDETGLLFTNADFCVLLYPAKSAKWSFIRFPNCATGMNERIRYLIFATTPDIGSISQPHSTEPTGNTSEPTGNTSSPNSVFLASKLHGNDYKAVCAVAKGVTYCDYYLMFSSSASSAAAFVCSIIRAHVPEARLFTSETEGSWDAFARSSEPNKLRVLLVHELVVEHITNLPYLVDLVNPGKGEQFMAWCIGGDSGQSIPIYPSNLLYPETRLGRITATRLFPAGAALFLTPSILVAKPRTSARIFDWIIHRIKNQTPGTYKLVCGFGLRDFLLDVAIEKSTERDAFCTLHADNPAKDAMAVENCLSYEDCAIRFDLYNRFCNLLKNEDLLGYPFDYDLDCPDESLSPIIYAPASIGTNDEEALVAWFASWSLTRLDRHRRFAVVGTGPHNEGTAVRNRLTKRPKMKSVNDAPGHPPRRSQAIKPSHSRTQGPFPTHAVLSPRPNYQLSENKMSSTSKGEKPVGHSANTHRIQTRPQGCGLDSAGDLPQSGKVIKTPMISLADQIDRHKFENGSIYPDNRRDFIALKTQKSQTGHLGTTKGDRIRLFSHVSDSFYLGKNLRTKARGRISAQDVGQSALRVATTKVTPHHKPQVSLEVGDPVHLIKHVSGMMFQAKNLRTGAKGQISTLHVEDPGVAYNEEALDVDEMSLPQLDGPMDPPPGRGSSGTSHLGIVTSDKGDRSITAALRASGTNMQEKMVREESVPLKNDDKYLASDLRRDSVSGAPSTLGRVMNVDSSGMNLSAETEIKEVKEVLRFQATTKWYQTLRDGGKGWEHIVVDEWKRVQIFLEGKK